MNKFQTWGVLKLWWLVLLLFSCSSISLAQASTFSYTRVIGFSLPDSLISPYLCTVDSKENLWVVSSTTNDAKALNALFKASPGDSVLHLVIAFADSDSVRNITGIASMGDDIFVVSRMIPSAGYPQPYYYPFSQMFYLPRGDPSKLVKFKRPVYYDYGTWYSGLAVTKDGYLYSGQSYLVTVISFDGRTSSPNFGNSINYAGNGITSRPLEPGGGLTYPNVIDLIRDVAVYSDSNYGNDTTAVVFTSRNSGIDQNGVVHQTGGIAAWTGASASDPLAYHAVRVVDQLSFLQWGTSAPYGIAVQPKTGYLFACGTDTTRRWVKGFQVIGNFAIQMDELPSSTSGDLTMVDPAGAPFSAPADVAFNGDGSIAYVADAGSKRVYVFKSKSTGVGERIEDIPLVFELLQNFPNPFNPGTIITLRLGKATKARILVYNSLGQVVKVLADGVLSPGTHNFYFDGSSLAPGIYFCRVLSDVGVRAIKMALLK